MVNKLRRLKNTSLYNDANLVAYFELNGNANATVGTFSTISQLGGTYGTSYCPFNDGTQGYYSDGNAAGIFLSNNNNLNFGTSTDYSFSFWTKTPAQIHTYPVLFAAHHTAWNGTNNNASIDARTFLAYHNVGLMTINNYKYNGIANYPLIIDEWEHIVYSRSGNTYTIYVNGIKADSQTVSDQSMNFSSASGSTIAYSGWDGSNSYLKGAICDFAIFNRALTDLEVKYLFRDNSLTYGQYIGENTQYWNPTRTVESELPSALSGSTSCVAYWKFEGNSTPSKGTFTMTDTSMSYGTGIFGNGAIFNGIGSIRASSNSALNFGTSTDFSLSFWCKPTFPQVDPYPMMISNGVDNYASGGVYVMCGNGPDLVDKISLHIPDSTQDYGGGFSNIVVYSKTSVLDGAWHHIVIQRSGITFRLYFDGVLESQRNEVVACNFGTTYTYIGKGYASNTSTQYTGMLDDVAFFNRALTQTEIETLSKTTKQRRTRLLVHMDNSGVDEAAGIIPTPSNITYVTGKFGNCASFNGSSSKLAYNSTHHTKYTFDKNMTISAWIKPAVNNVNMCVIGKIYDLTHKEYLLAFNTSGSTGIPSFIISTDGSNQYEAKNTTKSYAAGVWYHLLGTYDGDNIKMYVNGELIGTTAVTGSIYNSDSHLSIGNLGTYAGDWFNGLIDEVFMEDVTWDASKIKKYYTYSKGRFN